MKRGAHRIGYARVSTEDQNLALQLDALRAAGCTRVFCDEGVSGAARSRPALQQALAALRPGDTLVTWRLDRLGRSLSHLIDIIEDLGSGRIEFCSLLEGMDTTTASGEFAFHILGAMAHFERRIIGERTKAGMASAKARGVVLGRPPKLTAAQISRARRDLAVGTRSAAEIAARMGVAPVTLARALRRTEEAEGSPDRTEARQARLASRP
jgi:DNA invertase Pin-like site-specific DNA recombinase